MTRYITLQTKKGALTTVWSEDDDIVDAINTIKHFKPDGKIEILTVTETKEIT